MATCVVLVEPQGAGNVGAVARAMMNFGFRELRLIAPHCDPLAREARMAALDALPLLEAAQTFATLDAALTDRQWSVGTTRREGKYRSHVQTARDACAALALDRAAQRTALVFGREDRGLRTAELDLCQGLLTIATHEHFPSMNLAHAVTVCLYELATANDSASPATRSARTPAGHTTLEAMFQHMRRTLSDIEYLDAQNPDHILRAFRQILSRAELDEREVRILHGLWSRIDYVATHPRAAASTQHNPTEAPQ